MVRDALQLDPPLAELQRLRIGASVSVMGWAMVSIPSATTPRLRKKDDTAHMIQPVMALSRRTSAVAAATTPRLAAPVTRARSPSPTTRRSGSR
jgi:hypothetical protein